MLRGTKKKGEGGAPHRVLKEETRKGDKPESYYFSIINALGTSIGKIG